LNKKDRLSVELNDVKILLLGLDNSGKTSIILSLGKTTNLLSYCSLKPTTGINIVNVKDRNTQTNFNIWDCGGQEKYRKDYLKDLSRHFSEVDKVIFVIDVQDIKRYDLALEYLGLITEYVRDKEITADFSIFLHKFDPGLENLKDFSNEKISKTLITKIKEIVPEKFNFKIYKTTIYTVFEKQLFM